MKNYLTTIFKKITIIDWTGLSLVILYLLGKEYWWHKNRGRLTVNTILDIREKNLKKPIENRKKCYKLFLDSASKSKKLTDSEISNIKFLFGLENE